MRWTKYRCGQSMLLIDPYLVTFCNHLMTVHSSALPPIFFLPLLQQRYLSYPQLTQLSSSSHNQVHRLILAVKCRWPRSLPAINKYLSLKSRGLGLHVTMKRNLPRLSSALQLRRNNSCSRRPIKNPDQEMSALQESFIVNTRLDF